MKRVLFRRISLTTRNFLHSYTKTNQNPVPSFTPLAASTRSRLRFFSSDSDSSVEKKPDPVLESASVAEAHVKDFTLPVEDVKLKTRIKKYFEGDEEALPSVLEAILRRKLAGKHEETDDELMDELEVQPRDDVDDEEFESDFDNLYSTDEEIENLYSARDIVVKRMVKDEYFNMDDQKWDEMIKEAVQHGYLKDTKECEEILEDMLSWDKLLP
ncbi:hypothetical protein Gotur_022136, partial [Gossypium turneri]